MKKLFALMVIGLCSQSFCMYDFNNTHANTTARANLSSIAMHSVNPLRVLPGSEEEYNLRQLAAETRRFLTAPIVIPPALREASQISIPCVKLTTEHRIIEIHQ